MSTVQMLPSVNTILICTARRVRQTLYVYLVTVHRKEVMITVRRVCLATPWRRVRLENLLGPQVVKKSSAFYGTQSSIIAFNFCIERDHQFPRHPNQHFKINFNIIRNSAPGSWKWTLHSGFRTRILYAILISPVFFARAPPISFLLI
jgi:hypothetical protein